MPHNSPNSVEARHVASALATIKEIGISGLLIAAAEACEITAKVHQARNKNSLAETWFQNGNFVQEASELVSDPDY